MGKGSPRFKADQSYSPLTQLVLALLLDPGGQGKTDLDGLQK